MNPWTQSYWKNIIESRDTTKIPNQNQFKSWYFKSIRNDEIDRKNYTTNTNSNY